MTAPCPLGHQPMGRGERRRREREIEATRPAPGLGLGWRLNVRGRRYPVREVADVPLAHLIAESDAVARRLGCTCVGVAHG